MKKIFIGHAVIKPLGELWIAVSEIGLVSVDFPVTQEEFVSQLQKKYGSDITFDPEKIGEVVRQLEQFAAGELKDFSLKIDWSIMQEFQQHVLQATARIPYGETRTYKDIAVEIGNPLAARAVGRAEATNPIPIILPCHRVLGTDGKLHGYGAGDGLNTKTWLLKLEGAFVS